MSEIFPEKSIPSPVCRLCGCVPVDAEIGDLAEECGMSPDEYVVREDGTYSRDTHTFICDKDYVQVTIQGVAWPNDSTPWPTFNTKESEGGE